MVALDTARQEAIRVSGAFYLNLPVPDHVGFGKFNLNPFKRL
jgi:hypothetical protein